MIACTTWITLIHMQKKKNRIKPAIQKKKSSVPRTHVLLLPESTALPQPASLPMPPAVGTWQALAARIRQPWMSIWHLICITLSWKPWPNPSLGPPVSLDVDVKEGDTKTWMATHLIWDTCSFLGQETHASEQLSQCATTTEAKCRN